MGNIVYSHPSDNLSPVSIGGGVDWAVVSGTGDSDYPATNLGDLNPAKPARLTGTSGGWQRNFGSAKRVDIVAIPHHNLTAGLEVRIQANATGFPGTATLNQQFTVPAYRSDGHPVGFWLDLATLIPTAGNRTFQYWFLNVVGVNSAAVAVGEVYLSGTRRQLIRNPAWGFVKQDDKPLIRHTTDFGVTTAYPYGVSIRKMRGRISTQISDGAVEQLEAWWQAAEGQASPFFFALDSDVNDAMMARFDMPEFDREFATYNDNQITVAWREVGRGLKL